MTIKTTLISVATAAAVIAGGSFAIAQTTGAQAPQSESSSAGSPNPTTGPGMGNTTGQGAARGMDGTRSGTGNATGTTGQADSMGRTGSQTARMDRN